MSCPAGTGCHGHTDCADRNCPGRGQGAVSGTAGNVALISVLVALFILLLAWIGPAIDDHSGDAAAADAIQTAQARERYIVAAQKLCGINAGVIEQADGSMRCALHTGRKTARVAMVAP